MNTNFVRALLFTVLSLSCITLAAHDDSDRDPSNDRHRRPRAADLADCCTPGDADFPKVSGHLGNQSHWASRAKQIEQQLAQQVQPLTGRAIESA